ncbi:hypothetical protein Pan44_35100 [Caulifigura coniformis]|uniref:DUF72 domain-containing protein n=1 Tax=Caulifigura coniformis TaxID=2527983 RepID=A0A517SH99_9PLAN|nr:DUF72 domain-containing protein [Caulifigura coniformis]QDT55467.1 hypothetical protein Pan44_35100 [Caulifigura coniformis]
MSERLPYFIGCPVWTSPAWKGTVYRAKAPRSQWLGDYSRVFPTVEGNTTFYALPSVETARRWAAETEPGFRFALKFPQAVSHERRLTDCTVETRAFLQVLDVLQAADRLGPSFLQLPPTFDASEFPKLQSFLKRLPAGFPYAVEVRHRDYFDQGRAETALDQLLMERGVDRVLFDSRPLYSSPPVTEAEKASQTRKPRSPFRTTVTGPRPMVRVVGRDKVDQTIPWLTDWADTVSGWIRSGLEPYVFTHAPDDAFAADMAETFHDLLRARLPQMAPLPTWPGRAELQAPRQQTLF